MGRRGVHRAIAGALLNCLLFTAQSIAVQTATNLKDIRTIFIGSFGDKPGAEALRTQVAEELEKTHRLRVVKDAAQADAVLGGKGEIWVKEHYSLNPRSRSFSDTQAIYEGYLSVELQGKKETLWSYLAPPHSTSGNVDRELAKIVVRKLTDAIAGQAGK